MPGSKVVSKVVGIDHISIRVRDYAKSRAFYAKLFDWQTAQNASGSYMKMDSSDGPSGGWVRADLVQSPGPIAYLVVDDLEAKMDAGFARVDRKLDQLIDARRPRPKPRRRNE